MMQCPLPPGPTLDLLAHPAEFLFSLGFMLILASSGLLLPGGRRLGQRFLYTVAGLGVLVGGYALGYATAQHWIDGLRLWEESLPYGCFSPDVSNLVWQETSFALGLAFVGQVITGLGVIVGAWPSVTQLAPQIRSWWHLERGVSQ